VCDSLGQGVGGHKKQTRDGIEKALIWKLEKDAEASKELSTSEDESVEGRDGSASNRP